MIKELYELGVSKVCMLTGDNERTAAAVAKKLDLTEYRAEVLPEDKLAFIKAEHAAGRKVIMVGDGVNDAPALSESDVGIAVNEGAAIAREIADITISSDDLRRIVTSKKNKHAADGENRQQLQVHRCIQCRAYWTRSCRNFKTFLICVIPQRIDYTERTI